MSSDSNRSDEPSKKPSPDIMKKLNDAFSSYLDGEEKAVEDTEKSEKDSLLELVRAGIAEKQGQMAEEHVGIIGADQANEDPIDDEDVTNSEELIVPSLDNNEVDDPTPAISEMVPDVLTAGFENVQYQSVEIEVDEIEEQSDDEEISDYSGVLSDILKKRSENPRDSVVEPELIPQPKVVRSDADIGANGPGSILDENKISDVAAGTRLGISVEKAPEKPAPIKPEFKKPLLRTEGKSSAGSTSSLLSKKTPSSSTVEKDSDIKERARQKAKLQSQPITSAPSRPSVTATAVESSISSPKAADKATEKKVPNIPAGPVNIAFLYNKDHTSHDAASLSINTHEKPERLIKAMWYLEKSKVFEDGTCTLINDFGMADESDLLRVHDKSYVSFVSSYSSAGGGFLGDSTYMTTTSYDIAKMAAGAAIAAGDLLMDKKFTHAFVLARPPGHHASSQKYGGFCLFNNAAILARYLQERRNVKKILILDWDAHAGDGTMEVFYDDPSVMFLSTHRDPHGFYPRKGFSTQIGENAGKGYTLNVEMPEGSGNGEYMMAFDEAIVPMIRHFSPDFLIVSCGFDAYHKEKNIGLTLDSDGYHQMTEKVRTAFSGPMVFLMEGGYHDQNGQLCHSVLNSLHGRPNPINDRLEISSFKLTQQKQIFAAAEKKVNESKKNNPILASQVP
ncbi:histone deacetylase family protein [Methanolobus profundi]|uniref:Acetoin utilization deacetylase AcuC n=1 Tax=Methanolobus profundi TaxID=487685 RepID=A0A1I4Q1P8_9EURY|nr:histone deacetylase [Methanolobus profundi]SFM34008.1 Acetoin utilization deacetylase AcuC [Methanolobus profundi]